MSENNGWIKCSERLPEKYERVLIVVGGFQHFAILSDGIGTLVWETEEFDLGNGEFSILHLEAVTYWQPELPIPKN